MEKNNLFSILAGSNLCKIPHKTIIWRWVTNWKQFQERTCWKTHRLYEGSRKKNSVKQWLLWDDTKNPLWVPEKRASNTYKKLLFTNSLVTWKFIALDAPIISLIASYIVNTSPAVSVLAGFLRVNTVDFKTSFFRIVYSCCVGL